MTDYLQFTYPRFQPAQPLKSSDLNALVRYLEQQERLTRVYLIGSGIFYGLEPRLVADPSDPTRCLLTLTKGAGVSSQGYLFVVRAGAQAGLPGGASAAFGYWASAKVEKSLFTGALTDAELFDVYEFLGETTPTNGAKPILPADKAILKDRVVVLVWEETFIERKSCISSCDGPGADMDLGIRVLSMTEADLKKIWLNKTDDDGSGDGPALANYPYVKRLHNWQKAWTDITSPAALYAAWRQIVTPSITPATAPIPAGLHAAFSGADSAVIEAHLSALLAQMPADDPNIQYFYDYLLDLVAAYEELAMLRSKTVLTWCPDESVFPRFVALGTPDLWECRMPFYRVQTPDTNQDQGKLEFLQDRLEWLLDAGTANFAQLPNLPLAFSPIPRNKKENVRITGSRMKSTPLSQQAIPFYYGKQAIPAGPIDVENATRAAWSYEYHNAGRSLAIQGYENLTFDAAGVPHADPPPRQALCYDLGGSDFFRIEGHVGLTLRDGYTRVEKLRESLNLPFEITAVRVGLPINLPTGLPGAPPWDELLFVLRQLTFSTFAQDHPGMEHMAGVPKGGTFILVYAEMSPNNATEIEIQNILDAQPVNTEALKFILTRVANFRIIGDFCLPYSCFKAPMVQYIFEDTACPPEAGCKEKSRIYTEKLDKTTGEIHPVVQLELENTSRFADPAKYEWKIKAVTPANAFPEFTRTDEHISLEFNLDEVQVIEVSLTAHGLDDTFPPDTETKVVKLCPDAVELYLADPATGAKLQEVLHTWGLNETSFEFRLEFAPPGGKLALDSAFKNATVSRKTGHVLFNLPAAFFNQTVDYTITYEYPCTGLKKEFVLHLVEAAARPGSGEIATEEVTTRVERYAANLDAAADDALKATTAYKRTLAYVLQPHADWEKALSEYKSAARAVLNGIGKAGGATDAQYLALYQNLIWRWLDKTAEANPSPLPELLGEALDELAKTLKDLQADAKTLVKNWNADEVKTKANNTLIQTIQKRLTS